MKMKQKSEPLKSLKRELVKALWNPTWEPEELPNICERLDTASKCAKSLSRHRTYRNLQQTHTFMIFKNKGSQPTKKETSPMTSNFGTKSILTSSLPTLKQTFKPLGAVSAGSLTLIS
jgi:hypothetical protein